MAPEFIFKHGFSLFKFVTKFSKKPSNGGYWPVETQLTFAIGRNADETMDMVKNHYRLLGVDFVSIQQVIFSTPHNDVSKLFSSPFPILGFSKGVYVKTPAVKEVLELLDDDEDSPDNLSSIIKQVSSKRGLTIIELERELEPFI